MSTRKSPTKSGFMGVTTRCRPDGRRDRNTKVAGSEEDLPLKVSELVDTPKLDNIDEKDATYQHQARPNNLSERLDPLLKKSASSLDVPSRVGEPATKQIASLTGEIEQSLLSQPSLENQEPHGSTQDIGSEEITEMSPDLDATAIGWAEAMATNAMMHNHTLDELKDYFLRLSGLIGDGQEVNMEELCSYIEARPNYIQYLSTALHAILRDRDATKDLYKGLQTQSDMIKMLIYGIASARGSFNTGSMDGSLASRSSSHQQDLGDSDIGRREGAHLISVDTHESDSQRSLDGQRPRSKQVPRHLDEAAATWAKKRVAASTLIRLDHEQLKTFYIDFSMFFVGTDIIDKEGVLQFLEGSPDFVEHFMSAIHYITDDTYQTDVIIEWICKESIIVRHRMDENRSARYKFKAQQDKEASKTRNTSSSTADKATTSSHFSARLSSAEPDGGAPSEPLKKKRMRDDVSPRKSAEHSPGQKHLHLEDDRKTRALGASPHKKKSKVEPSQLSDGEIDFDSADVVPSRSLARSPVKRDQVGPERKSGAMKLMQKLVPKHTLNGLLRKVARHCKDRRVPNIDEGAQAGSRQFVERAVSSNIEQTTWAYLELVGSEANDESEDEGTFILQKFPRAADSHDDDSDLQGYETETLATYCIENSAELEQAFNQESLRYKVQLGPRPLAAVPGSLKVTSSRMGQAKSYRLMDPPYATCQPSTGIASTASSSTFGSHRGESNPFYSLGNSALQVLGGTVPEARGMYKLGMNPTLNPPTSESNPTAASVGVLSAQNTTSNTPPAPQYPQPTAQFLAQTPIPPLFPPPLGQSNAGPNIPTPVQNPIPVPFSIPGIPHLAPPSNPVQASGPTPTGPPQHLGIGGITTQPTTTGTRMRIPVDYVLDYNNDGSSGMRYELR